MPLLSRNVVQPVLTHLADGWHFGGSAGCGPPWRPRGPSRRVGRAEAVEEVVGLGAGAVHVDEGMVDAGALIHTGRLTRSTCALLRCGVALAMWPYAGHFSDARGRARQRLTPAPSVNVVARHPSVLVKCHEEHLQTEIVEMVDPHFAAPTDLDLDVISPFDFRC